MLRSECAILLEGQRRQANRVRIESIEDAQPLERIEIGLIHHIPIQPSFVQLSRASPHESSGILPFSCPLWSIYREAGNGHRVRQLEFYNVHDKFTPSSRIGV